MGANSCMTGYSNMILLENPRLWEKLLGNIQDAWKAEAWIKMAIHQLNQIVSFIFQFYFRDTAKTKV